MGAGGNRKAKTIHTLGRKMRKYKRHKMRLRGLRHPLKSNPIRGDGVGGTSGDNQERGMSVMSTSPFKGCHGHFGQALSKEDSMQLKPAQSPAVQKEFKSCVAVSNDCNRKSRKWKTLVRLGNSVLSGHISAQTTRKKGWEKKMVDRRAKRGRGEFQSASRSSIGSSHDHTKSLSSDNSEWPSLPVSGRTRAHAKETATEIVKSKHNASITKTRKGWADIVSKRNKESVTSGNNQQVIDKKKAETGPNTDRKTWASVAATGTSKCQEIGLSKSISGRDAEQCGEPYTSATPSGSCKKKRRKANFSLAYTDRIWLTCQKSKGNTHVHNFYRKHFGDRKSNASKRRSNPASPRKKICGEKRHGLQQQERQVSAAADMSSVPQTLSKGCCLKSLSSQARIIKGAHMKCTSSDHDSDGQNACLVDNMPEVYTKKAGMVITLNESNHDRTTHKNVNKCNNRLNRAEQCRFPTPSRKTISDDSVGPSSVSGNDLCSQLSSMTFQTPNESGCARSEEASVSYGMKKTLDSQNSSGTCKRSQPTGQPNILKASHTEGVSTKQKKVSLRYRALLRDGCGPLDARAVSNINKRNRRADNLQDSKVATRAMRRRQRQEHQNTTHISRRTQASSATDESAQPSKPGPSGQVVKVDQRQADGIRESKQLINRKTLTLTAPADHGASGASSISNAGETGRDSSRDSSDCDVSRRSADCNGTNNSRRRCDESEYNLANPQLASLRKQPLTGELDVKTHQCTII